MFLNFGLFSASCSYKKILVKNRVNGPTNISAFDRETKTQGHAQARSFRIELILGLARACSKRNMYLVYRVNESFTALETPLVLSSFLLHF